MCDSCHRAYVKPFRHGLSIGEAEDLLASQGGRCAICQRSILLRAASRIDAACVDHDHRCCPGVSSCGNCIRGLLCGTCNTAIGLMKDDYKLLARASHYVKTCTKSLAELRSSSERLTLH